MLKHIKMSNHKIINYCQISGSKKLNKINQSETIKISNLAMRLKQQGKDIISLSAGEPDFDTPDNIKEAAIQAIKIGDTKYTAVDGTPALKKAIKEKHNNKIIIRYS